MRKFFALIVAALAVSVASAQPPMGPPMGPPPGMGRDGEQGPKKSPQERIAHITKELNLTEEQAEKFAPVYLAYQGEMRKIRKDLKTLMESYEGQELDDKLAFRKAMDQLNAEADMVACKKEYLRVFKDHLNPEQLSKIFLVERRGNRPPGPPPGAPQDGKWPPQGGPQGPRQ